MTQTRQQQAIFPSVPIDQPLVDKDGNMSLLWQLFFTNLIQSLQTNFKPEGIVVPSQSDTNISALTATQSIANILYDVTNNDFKGNVNGTWKTFTLT